MSEPSEIRELLWQLAFCFKVRCKRAVRESGLRLGGMHVRAMGLLEAEGECTAQHLCAISGRDKAQITRLLQDLEEQGLLNRLANPADKRSRLLRLTDKATCLMRRVKDAEASVEADFVEGLTEQELETFVGISRKMLRKLRQ